MTWPLARTPPPRRVVVPKIKNSDMGSLGNTRIVVVFDFDKTIIDCDSDNWVVDAFGATERFDHLIATMPWNSAIDKIMGELHEKGVSMEDIAECLRKAPMDPHAIEGIKSAHALGCDLRVVSDANHFFIKTILEHHGIIGCFSEINTNPGFVDAEGRLRVLPYHDFRGSHHHGCPLSTCPPNMCKGLIIKRIQAEAAAEGKTRFIYLGDGKGDYCPSLKLAAADYFMPRKDFPVWDLLCSDLQLVKAEVHGWSNWKEQQEILLELIKKAISADEDSSKLLPADHKFRNVAIAVIPEALPKVLPVI